MNYVGLVPSEHSSGQTRRQGAITIAWKAQQRLHQTWRRLDTQRGKRKTIVAATVARQLTGFCWAVVTADTNQQTTT